MKDFAMYLLESGICLFIFWLIYQLFLRKETFFNFIRGYLIFGIFGSIIIPFFHFTYKVVITPQIKNTLTTTFENTNVDNLVSSGSTNTWMILVIIYLVGILLLLIKQIYAQTRVFQLIKKGCKFEQDGYTLVENQKVKSPFSVFTYIFINSKNLSDTEKYTILKHEESHIKQKHWIDLVLCELFVLFQWFNPFVWKYVSNIKENHEFLADKAVLNVGVPIVTYREVLVNQTLQQPIFSFSNSLNYSKHSKRFIMMSKEKSSDWKKVLVLTLLPLFGIIMWASAKPHYVVDSTANVIMPDSVIKKYTGKELLVINGKMYPDININMLDTVYIESISVLDAQHSINKYGDKAKNGVIYVSLKQGFDYSALDNDTKAVKKPQLYIIDGQKASEADFNKLNPSKILSLEVLADVNSVYGKEGENGIISVKTKK